MVIWFYMILQLKFYHLFNSQSLSAPGQPSHSPHRADYEIEEVPDALDWDPTLDSSYWDCIFWRRFRHYLEKKLHPAARPRKKEAPFDLQNPCNSLVSTPDYETPRLFHIPGAPGVPFKSTKLSLFGGVLPFWSHPGWKLFWVAKLIYQWSCLRRSIEDGGRFHSLQMTKQCSQRVPMRHHQNVPLAWPGQELNEAKPCLIHVD